MARIIIEGLKNKIVPNKILQHITILKEHLLTAINIHFDLYARIRFHIHLFVNKGGKPDLDLLIKSDSKEVSVDGFSEIFNNSFDYGNELKLIPDSQKSYIPIQFRFLSLYKWLELEFKEKGKWNDYFVSFAKSVENEFYKRELSNKKFSNYLHEIRDKCAHIKSNNDILGVTSLSYKDEEKVIEFTKFLIIICVEYFNQIKLKDKPFKMNYFGQHDIDLS